MEQQETVIAEARPTSVFARVNGIQLHYLNWGYTGPWGYSRKKSAARTVLLCHGGSAHCHWWDDVAPQLSEQCRVLALDFRGHGRSQWASSYGLPAYLDDLTSFIKDHIGKRVVLVGHSMGGEIAMQVAVNSPELLDAVVIADASPAGLPLKTRLIWKWKRRKQSRTRPEFHSREGLIARFRLSPPGHNLTPSRLADLAIKGAEQLPNGNWAFRLDPKTRQLSPGWRLPRCRIEKIRMPALILRGEHSALVSDRQVRRMVRRITGVQLATIPSAWHHVSLDNPEATASAIAEFVASI
ncbi:MAG TPA: alpha/beta hydrolase [Candidatus Binataceae bacterium]|nr:alpha/beta hydrolase [Candidatus Binataceae bacterium]